MKGWKEGYGKIKKRKDTGRERKFWEKKRKKMGREENREKGRKKEKRKE